MKLTENNFIRVSSASRGFQNYITCAKDSDVNHFEFALNDNFLSFWHLIIEIPVRN